MLFPDLCVIDLPTPLVFGHRVKGTLVDDEQLDEILDGIDNLLVIAAILVYPSVQLFSPVLQTHVLQ